MYFIKTVKNRNELKKLFYFFAITFYEEAQIYNEPYYTMGERFIEMEKQYETDPELIIYIEDNGKMLAGITGKGLDKENQKITVGLLAVDSNYRNKGYATALMKEFEKRCIKKGIKHIELGARLRACPFYHSLKYIPQLMVQVYDFVNINEIRKVNKFHLKEKSSWQADTYGFIIFYIDEINDEYIEWFEETVPTSHAQYLFSKDV